MGNKQPVRIKTISEFHKLWQLPKPEHPLISIVDYTHIDHSLVGADQPMILGCYSITIKRDLGVKMIYGQQSFDFDEGVMFFMAPHQVLRVEKEPKNISNRSGWILLMHPDFLWNTLLAKTIKRYEFFQYAMHEALFLSEKEEEIVENIIKNIQMEYHSNIDRRAVFTAGEVDGGHHIEAGGPAARYRQLGGAAGGRVVS